MTAYGFINFWSDFSRYCYKHYITILPSRESPILALTPPSKCWTTVELCMYPTAAKGVTQMCFERENPANFCITGQIKEEILHVHVSKPLLSVTTVIKGSQVSLIAIRSAHHHKVSSFYYSSSAELPFSVCVMLQINSPLGMAQLSGTSVL